MTTSVIYEGTPGVRLTTPDLTIVGSSGDELVTVALAQVAAGARDIQLCGGVGAIEAAAVRSAVAGSARVRLNRYGFESLELITDFKTAFASGDVRPSVFLYSAAPGAPTVEHEDVTVIPVPDPGRLEDLGAELAGRGIGLVELYGDLGVDAAAAVVRGSGGAVPVGFIDHAA